jgi:PAS domain S-box-containing protein
MLSELLQDRAALYVAGAMTAPERENFELILEFHNELRMHVAELESTAAFVWTAHLDTAATIVPPLALKTGLLAALDTHPQQTEPDAVVVANTAGLVEWINPAFTTLCGYSLDELKGRKPGHLLQGADTDPAAVQRIRESLREKRACRETLTNYHKDGSAYRVSVAIAPILDDERQPLWFIARERKVPSDQSVPSM